LVGGTGIVVLCTSPNDLTIGHNVRANTAFKGLKLAQFLGQPDVFLTLSCHTKGSSTAGDFESPTTLCMVYGPFQEGAVM
jgi:hypothetical protein